MKKTIKNRKPRGKPFNGKAGPGRPKGSVNKVTKEAKAACAAIVDSVAYRERLRKRAEAGRLPPAVETMLWHYAYGKPKEKVDIDATIQGSIRIVHEYTTTGGGSDASDR